MIFHASNFKGVLEEDQAKVVAKLCNDLIDKNGILVWGTMYEGKKAMEWSSTKEPQDVHTGILIGVAEMGMLEPVEESVKLDQQDPHEMIKALELKVRNLERRGGK